MLLQNTLDLSTFEIVRFRIWNQTSNPNDYGLGTKYFNTNSGHEGYNRENIYTATGWRRAAYMDDIEAITNGEGSLGTRVKTLEDMLNVDSAETVVSTWAEIQAFLDQVQEGTDLMDLLNSKFDKTGGTITVKSLDGFEIKRTSGTLPFIKFSNDTGVLGYLGFSAEGNPSYYDALQQNSYKLLHSGNVGDYALKVDGSNAMTGDLQLLTMSSGTVNVAVTEGLFIYRGPSSGGTDVDLPENYINIFNIGGINAYSNLQLAWKREYPKPKVFARIGESSGYSDWKTLAFTDSDITGNATTATKLKESVSLWGNSFDGMRDVSDNINLPNSRAIKFYLSDKTTLANVIQVNDNNALLLGQGIAQNSGYTVIYGNNIQLCYGTAGSTSLTAMIVNSSGNVTIGASELTTKGERLYVNGVLGIHGLCNTRPTLTTIPQNGLVLYGWNKNYGMSQWVENSGNSFIQSGTFGSDNAVYNLVLQPLGGNVGIGITDPQYKLDVVGTINSNDRIYTPFLFLGKGQEGIYLDNAGIAWHDTSNSWSGTLLKFSNDLVRITQSTRIEGELLATGLTSFSSRVLIGGALDDRSIAKLQVDGSIAIGNENDSSFIMRRDAANRFIASRVGGHFAWRVNGEATDAMILGADGLATFNGGALIPTGQTLTIGSVTFRETAEGEVEVDGNLHTTGTLASGGKAQEGTGSTGNAMVYQYDLASGESVYTVDNVKGSTNVIVQIYEWNSNTSSWDMILTDVNVKASGITVTFGRATTVNHMVTVC